MYQKKSFNSSLSRSLFFLVIFLLLFLVFFYVPRLSIPIAFAYLLTLVIRPLFPLLYRMGLGRKVSFALICVLFGCIILIPAIRLYPLLEDELVKARENIPQLESLFRNKMNYFREEIKGNYGLSLSETIVNQWIDVVKSYLHNSLFAIPQMITAFLEWLFLVPLFMYFMVAEGISFQRAFATIVPNRYFEKIYYIVHQFDKKIGSYIFAKFIEANLVGLIIGVGLGIMNFPFALLLGFLAGLTNIIPYLGPILGFVPVLVVFLTAPQYSSFIGPVILLYGIANVVDLFIIFPLLVSRIVNLHPLIVIVSVIIGSQLWGIVGMIISVPLANVVKLILGEIYRELYPVRLRY
ncbi:MAG: AI-2E family transporter [Bacteriovoracaceae bacterium]